MVAKHGADVVIDPTTDNAAELIRDQTNNAGVDVSIEVSANYAGLNEAIRSTGYAGRIVSAAYYVGDSSLLSLEGEWHRNQLTIVSTRNANPTLRNVAGRQHCSFNGLDTADDDEARCEPHYRCSRHRHSRQPWRSCRQLQRLRWKAARFSTRR